MRLIDAHCHLDLPEFDSDRVEVIESAKNKGVSAIVDSGLGPTYGRKALELAKSFSGYVFPTLGLEPYNLSSDDFDSVISLIRASSDMIVGIGEVGLDYYWRKESSERQVQIDRFKSFISLAKELDLPLVIHSRSAGKYALRILKDEGAKWVLMHAFDGKVGWALMGVDAGYYFSIPTSVWMSRQKQKLVKHLPLSHLMLESDSPVLSPFGEGRNEPSNLTYALKKVAEIKRVDEEVVERETCRNAMSFFKLNI